PRRVALFLLAERNEAGLVLGRVPRTLRPVGADEVVHLAPGCGPLGQRGAAAEFDVVGMGGDGQCPGRDFDVARDLDGHGAANAVRSAGMSMSQPNDGSRTTRRLSASRRASAVWRA